MKQQFHYYYIYMFYNYMYLQDFHKHVITVSFVIKFSTILHLSGKILFILYYII